MGGDGAGDAEGTGENDRTHSRDSQTTNMFTTTTNGQITTVRFEVIPENGILLQVNIPASNPKIPAFKPKQEMGKLDASSSILMTSTTKYPML